MLNADQEPEQKHSSSNGELERSFSMRLKAAIGQRSVLSFAKECGFSDSLVRKYLGGSLPGLDKAVAMAGVLGVSLEWLATGEGAMFPTQDTEEVRNVPSEEFVYITQMAGSNGVVNRLHAVRADWLKERGLEPRHLTVMENHDDAMAPTIQPGDLLLCQTYMHRTDSNIAIGLAPGELPPQDGVYFIRRGEMGPRSLRRLRLDMADGAIISADADSSVHLHADSEVMAGIVIEARVVSFRRIV